MLPSNALSHLCLQVKQWLKPANSNSLTPLLVFFVDFFLGVVFAKNESCSTDDDTLCLQLPFQWYCILQIVSAEILWRKVLWLSTLLTSTNHASEMTVRMISIWALALFYWLGKRGKEKDTAKIYARNILQSPAPIPQTFFNYVTFPFQNIKH